MIYAVKALEGTVYEFKTDSCLYKLPKGAEDPLVHAKIVHLDRIAAGMTLSSRFPMATCDDCDELAFRVAEAKEEDLIRCQTTLPKREEGGWVRSTYPTPGTT